MRQHKLIDFDSLKLIKGNNKASKVTHCHGVFDVLHAGHLAYFNSAKKFGSVLVVTVTADEFVNKGPGRPHFNSRIRAEMLAALEVVDYVAISGYPTAVPVINALKPDFYVKGPDYKDKSKDITGAILEEEAAVEAHGGKLVFTDDEAHSSSNLINKFFHHWTEDQTIAINNIKKAGGLGLIEDLLEKISRETVCVVGEPIVDTYVFCSPENLSSKSPSISAKFLYQEDYAGGILAIANHLAGFVKDTTLVTTHGDEPYFQALLKEKLNAKIELVAQGLPNVPTPRKTRFIAHDKSQRMFELTDLRSDQWVNNKPDEFCQVLKKENQRADSTIIADFGHGLFEGLVLEALRDFRGFIGLNVQTNSSNFGFNPYTKHSKFSYLSIDTKEVRVAYHNRFTPPLDLVRKVHRDVAGLGASCAMTLGAQGAYYFPADSSQEYFAPALADSVVDTTGSGDAFFAMTSLLIKVGCPHDLVPFLGNVFAGLKAKIIGNKYAVTRAQFHKALTSILK